jgi:uncharacterized protein (DUF1697 family)
MTTTTTAYVALLRAVNVGGRNKVPMAKLRDALHDCGYDDATTYIQSGNVVLTSASAATDVIDGVQRCIHDTFGFDVDVMVRSAAQLSGVLGHNPFLTDDADPKTLHVGFFDAEPEADAVTELKIRAAEAFGDDELAVAGTEIYLHYPNGSGRSKMSGAALERLLGVRVTARNWRTVETLHDQAAAR